ncbi:DNA mismatch repair protein MutS [Bosea thiooxidans]|jgi:DNA-nicking Smr family endonuclease|uniref:DNA mismatch repair protein MutS n=1 Tax=Bosea thiooxidans TaxID=53254 RepID=A0A0Q3I1B2_9HYPH|nr:Smr/MutS family protein [Bosea thiooxidans]KQK28767.1 DNA mismatch repair protein MutS [Bosea thiooxidans]SKC16746.1 DNA-nicking endonuclease, Smr domain [Bosea thiooxidans]
MRARRGRTLTEADAALWRQVARTVKPLPGRAPIEPEPVPEPAPAIATETSALAVAALSKAAKPASLAAPPLAPIERRLRTQLRRGQQSVDAVIDLHGMRQNEAHLALCAFLRREQAHGTRIALVVTGKGGPAPALFGEERGVLRRMVPHWLRLSELRPLVLGFEEAEQRHGGGGALYVRLRRLREHGP